MRPPTSKFTLFVAILMAVTIFESATAEQTPSLTLGSQSPRHNTTTLEPNKSLERALTGGESHSYQITLAINQYLRIEVEQRGIDLAVNLFGADGKRLSRLDTCSGTIGPELISVIADKDGTYQFEIEPLEKGATGGSYKIRIEASRLATEQDRLLFRSQSLFAEAQRLSRKGDETSLRLALKKYEETSSLNKSTGNRLAEAATQNNIGDLHLRFGEKREALESFRAALTDAQQVSDRKLEADALNSMGTVYVDSEPQKTLEYCNRALQSYQALSERLGEATALTNMGIAYSRLAEAKNALEYQTKALSVWRTLGQREGEANVLVSLGALQFALNKYQDALNYLNQGLLLAQAAGDLRGQASALGSIGTVYKSLGENVKALEMHQQSLALDKKIGNLEGQAISFVTIASVYAALGNNRLALEYLGRGFDIYKNMGNVSGEADVLGIRGEILGSIGENQNALEALLSAAQLYKQIGNVKDEAEAMVRVAQINWMMGEYQKALDGYYRVMPILQQTSNRLGEAVVYNDYGHIYTELGEYRKALDYLGLGLKLIHSIGDQENEATTLNNIGVVYYRQGNNLSAIENYTRALILLRKTGDQRGEGGTLTNIGTAYFAMRDFRKSLTYYHKALPLNRSSGDRASEAHTQTRIGEALAIIGQKVEALEYLTRALDVRRAIADRDGEALTLKLMANVKRELGRLQEARADLEASLTIVESQRTRINAQDYRGSYLAARFDYYESYIDLLQQMHKLQPHIGFDATALEASERGRARSLLDLLIEARAGIRQGVNPELVARERTLQQLLNDKTLLQIRLLSTKHSDEQAAEANKEIERLKTEYQQVEAEIKAKSPRYAALTQPQPLSTKQIQQLLDENTLLLEYSLGEHRSYLWAVTQSSLQSYELPKRANIEIAAKAFYQALIAPKQRSGNRLLSRVDASTQERRLMRWAAILSRMLFTPVASQLANKRLVIVADGVLHYVPFAALPDPITPSEVSIATPAKPRPLILDHEIANLPSASTLAILRDELERRKIAAKSVAVIADPVFERNDERVIAPNNEKSMGSQSAQTRPSDQLAFERTRKAVLQTGITKVGLRIPRLPGTRQEAETILSLAPPDGRLKALDFAASKATATGPELGQYRFVHFATHGFLNSANPELSGIVLSMVDERGNRQDGFLLANEVFDLHLAADLVVLSACQTGLGKEVRGEGLVGLTRGFMYAGAPRVIVSLWSVDDKATSALMERLYKGILQQNLSPAAALRAAQTEMWTQKQWGDPYFWGAFVLQGEWR